MSSENWEIEDRNDGYQSELVGVDLRVPPISPRLLIVDDSDLIIAMLSEALTARSYEFKTAGTLREAVELVTSGHFDIAVLDIKLPDGDAFRLLDEYPHLPEEAVVIIMSGVGELDNAVQALRRGVEDFISKPFTIPTFVERLGVAVARWQSRTRTRFYQAELEDLVKTMGAKLLVSDRMIDSVYDETVRALGAALNLRDPETEEHCRRVSTNSVILARSMGFQQTRLKRLQWGSYLHDIGKIGVPENILSKPATLTKEEMDLIRLHPVLGYRMVSNIEFLRGSTDVILYHHERYDGTGYPHGLRGKQIPIAARIFAVIDTMDAMLYDRPYRQATGYDEVVTELRRESGKQFDLAVVTEFRKIPEHVWKRAIG